MMNIKDIKLGDVLKFVCPKHVDSGLIGTVVDFESGYVRLLNHCGRYKTGILFAPAYLIVAEASEYDPTGWKNFAWE